MYYKQDEGKRRNFWAAVSTVAYVLVWLLLIWVVKFSFPERSQGEGIMINFGDTEQAGGEADPAVSDRIAEAASPETVSGQEDILTQDHQDAPAVTQPTQRPNRQTNPEVKPTQRPPTETTTPQEQPREVNRSALFPGRTEGSTSTSEGTSAGAGNQGRPEGSPTGSHDGTGTGDSGISFSLAGRQPVGELPKPDYGGNTRGRYVVKVAIVVNPAGTVTSASYQPTGSTTNERAFLDAALAVARRAKFTPSESDVPQRGVITYIFTIR